MTVPYQPPAYQPPPPGYTPPGNAPQGYEPPGYQPPAYQLAGAGGFAGRTPHRAATMADSVRAEWIKFRTLRSTYITLGVAVLLAVGVGALISWAGADHFGSSASDRNNWDPTSQSLSGLALAQLAVAVLGVMAVSGEYSSGMIRTSLAAVPRRSRWLAAKAAVFTAVILVLGEIISFAAFLIGQPIISSYAGVPYVNLGDHDVLRAVIGGGLYLAVIGLVAVALGALIRNTAGGIAVIVALIFVLPLVSNALPNSWQNSVQKYWPTLAGEQISTVVRTAHTLSPWAGLADFVVFAAIVLAVAFVLLLRRDA
jgi:ABC-2 type transport system permease protein